MGQTIHEPFVVFACYGPAVAFAWLEVASDAVSSNANSCMVGDIVCYIMAIPCGSARATTMRSCLTIAASSESLYFGCSFNYSVLDLRSFTDEMSLVMVSVSQIELTLRKQPLDVASASDSDHGLQCIPCRVLLDRSRFDTVGCVSLFLWSKKGNKKSMTDQDGIFIARLKQV